MIMSFLFSLLLSRFVYMVLQVHWTAARAKRGAVIRSTAKALNLVTAYFTPPPPSPPSPPLQPPVTTAAAAAKVGQVEAPSRCHRQRPSTTCFASGSTQLVSVSSSFCSNSPDSLLIEAHQTGRAADGENKSSDLVADDDASHQHARFGRRLRQLLRCGPHYAVRYLQGLRGENLGQELVRVDACSARDWSVLSRQHYHHRITLIYRQAMQLCTTAHERPGGALCRMKDDVLCELLDALVSANGSLSAMISSANPQKLPFVYTQLIQWGSRSIVSCIICNFALLGCERSLYHRMRFPFTCEMNDLHRCSSVMLVCLWVVVWWISAVTLGLLELHGALDNLYKNNCGPVQEGMLKGIDLMTRGLVETEMLDVLAADVHDVDQDEASEDVLVSGDRVVYGRV